MGPAPSTSTESPGRDLAAGDAVQRRRPAARPGPRPAGRARRAGAAASAGRPRCSRRRRRRCGCPRPSSGPGSRTATACPPGSACTGRTGATDRPPRRRPPPRCRRPSPTAATTPLHSWPSTTPGLPQPSRMMWMSDPQMPQWPTSTSTWPGPGRGTGRSSTVTSPLAVYTAAGMVARQRLGVGQSLRAVGHGSSCDRQRAVNGTTRLTASTSSGGPLDDDLAALEHDHVVGQGQGVVDLLLDDQQGGAAGQDAAQHVVHLVGDDRRQTRATARRR